MLGILLVALLCIIAALIGIVIWNFTNKDSDKYDPKLHRDILDVKFQRESCADAERTAIRNLKGKTRQAVEDDYKHDMGEDGFRRFMRG
jgi:hypothetical protein